MFIKINKTIDRYILINYNVYQDKQRKQRKGGKIW